MCGIVGITGHIEVTHDLLVGLKRLEYRGYDSVGIGFRESAQNTIQTIRTTGKISVLEESLKADNKQGTSGIGHCRWATHGAVVEKNSQPLSDAHIAVVHNGIIENYQQLINKYNLENKRQSDLDSEVLLLLLQIFLSQGKSVRESVTLLLNEIEGTYAFVILLSDDNLLVGARKGSPLVLSYDAPNKRGYLGSDPLSLIDFTDKIIYLEENDCVFMSPEGFSIYDENNQIVQREQITTQLNSNMIHKGNYRHYMQKEIYEQPSVLSDIYSGYVDTSHMTVYPLTSVNWQQVDKITMVACGTSYYATLIAEYWFEDLVSINVESDLSSEWRYRRRPPPRAGEMFMCISQSGETMDTVGSLRLAKGLYGEHILSLVNVANSSMHRESPSSILTRAGLEIGVATTKAFMAQLTVLYLLAINAAQQKNLLTPQQEKQSLTQLLKLPALLQQVLANESQFVKAAEMLQNISCVFFLGRGSNAPIAMEGALKLKEITYIHAEGYPAGEIKHGPIALIDNNSVVVGLLCDDALFSKTLANIQAVAARGCKLILIGASEQINKAIQQLSSHMLSSSIVSLVLPSVSTLLSPFLNTLAVQLLAYHSARLQGTDIDQPRNLAKSVTVE